MLYSRLLARSLLWLALMLTTTAVRENRTEECLGLCESLAQRICGGAEEVEERNGGLPKGSVAAAAAAVVALATEAETIARVSLTHCGRPLASTLPHGTPPTERKPCLAALRTLIRLDLEAKAAAINFHQILNRFDCPQPYSVKFQCHQCQEAYLSWMCSDRIAYWVKGRRVKPCRSYCRRVEQTCPFFLPLDKGPAHYAGEPTFLCLDPNIEETGEQLENSSYGPVSCCYEECDRGICIRGSCEDEESSSSEIDESSSPSSDGPSLALLIALLLASLLTYRTRRLM